MAKAYDALEELSGGLDSILAVKLIQDQGLTVLGLHFTFPFLVRPVPHSFGRCGSRYVICLAPRICTLLASL